MKPKLGRPRKFNSPEDLIRLFNKFLDSCYDENEINIKPITIISFCNYVGMHRDTFNEYSHQSLFSDTTKRIKAIMEEFAVEQLFSNPRQTSMIFLLKNNYGYVDKTEVETKNTNIQKTLNIEFIDKDNITDENTEII